MTIYQIYFYITKGDIEEIKRFIMPEHWIAGKDFFIEKFVHKLKCDDCQKLPKGQVFIPESILMRTDDVVITMWRRERKCDYFPSPHRLTIGWDKTDGLSYLMQTERSEVPRELYHKCESLLIRINDFINVPIYVCSKCQHIDCGGGSCSLCWGKIIKINKFGLKNEREWRRIFDRCNDINCKEYYTYAHVSRNNQNYEGRRFAVCNHWLKFENFLKDMGEVPDGCRIDRIDNNKDYCKDNCHWVKEEVETNVQI